MIYPPGNWHIPTTKRTSSFPKVPWEKEQPGIMLCTFLDICYFAINLRDLAKPNLKDTNKQERVYRVYGIHIYIMIFVCSKCKHIHTMLIFRFHDFKLAIQHLISGSPDIWEKRVVHIGFWNHKMPQGRGSKCSAYEQRGWGRRKKCATTTRGNHFWLGCHMAVMKRDSCWLVERHCNWSTWSERLWVMMNMPSLKLL